MTNWDVELAPIQPGDVFVKRWGERELIHVMLPRGPHSRKQTYMRLPSGGIDSTWCRQRHSYGNTSTERRWRYVGTVPDWFLTELLQQAA